MTDITEKKLETEVKTPAKRRKYTRSSVPAKPRQPNEFAGITATACPSACTPERCVISTVGVCKHPVGTGPTGCGPITMANREKALKIIKRQKAEAA